MAKLHSASPREITAPFTHEIISVLHSKACNNLYIFNGLKFTLHRTRVLNNVVITTVIEMVEMVEILDGRVGKRSVERVRYVIINLLHLVVVKSGVISLVLSILTRLRLVTILTLLVKYVIHADPCNKSYRSSYPLIIGRAKRAPHWGVQSIFRVIYY